MDSDRQLAVPASPPYRVVDRFGHGWYLQTAGYQPGRGGGLQVMSPADLDTQWGPVRPVVPAPAADIEELRVALRGAGRKAIATLCAAFHEIARAARDRYGSDDALVAGRPGSWESAAIREFAWEIGSDPAVSRVDVDALAGVVAVLERWVFDAEVCVEVAENTASALGPVIDEIGWNGVTDRWLRAQPSAGRICGYVVSRAQTVTA